MEKPLCVGRQPRVPDYHPRMGAWGYAVLTCGGRFTMDLRLGARSSSSATLSSVRTTPDAIGRDAIRWRYDSRAASASLSRSAANSALAAASAAGRAARCSAHAAAVDSAAASVARHATAGSQKMGGSCGTSIAHRTPWVRSWSALVCCRVGNCPLTTDVVVVAVPIRHGTWHQ
jgi:hypothetical protein